MKLRIVGIIVLIFVSTGTSADSFGIHKMMVGDKVLEVVETRQLTFRDDGDVQSITISPDGKYVVYLTIQPNIDSNSRIARMYLVKLSNEKSIMLMEGSLPDNDYPDIYQWKLPSYVYWSPNSKYFTLNAGLKMEGKDDNGKPYRRRESLLIFDTMGSMTGSYYLPKDYYYFPSKWSPDSSKVALVSRGNRDKDTGECDNTLIVYDLYSKQAQTLFTIRSRTLTIDKWTSDSEGVICCESTGDGKYVFHNISLDGQASTQTDAESAEYSYELLHNIPFDLISTDDGTAIKEISTGKTLCTIKGLKYYHAWAIPKTRFVRYWTQQDIQIEPNGAKTKLCYCWLVYPEGEKQNRMCVATADRHGNDVWSDNGLKIAYVSEGKAFVTDLEYRKATPREKTAAGVPLTDEETRTLLLENAHQISDAIEVSIMSSEYYPSQDDFIKRIGYYLRDKTSLLLPGTDKMAVTYFKPDDKYNIANLPPADTIIATLDSGYGWKLNIYADGRVGEALK
ncbi:hypothetical protein LLG46_02875 [bacterium]|nr:hypothetical protein [bacterium]